jgi:hypothetical protein
MALWAAILPVIQQIYTAGGYMAHAFISRAVIDELDRLADGGDASLIGKRAEILKVVKRGKWPKDPQAFKALFETYHEALFYILALRRGVPLVAIPRSSDPTPDFATVRQPLERFEVKTIDFSGGEYAYGAIMAEGHRNAQKAREEAAKRASPVSISHQTIRPHGDATNTKEAVERVLSQIARNVSTDQFSAGPTFLVLPMIRTALRVTEEELRQRRDDAYLGRGVTGHLWCIAAARLGLHFYDATLLDCSAHDLGTLTRAGLFRDFPFIAGVIFVGTEWNELGSADSAMPFPDQAFRTLGVWNATYVPTGHASKRACARSSSFAAMCDAWRPSQTLLQRVGAAIEWAWRRLRRRPD